MIFPENFEKKTGFDQIRLMLKKNCISPMGERYVDKIRFSSNFSLIKKMTEQVEELRQILLFEKPFPAQNFFDLTPELQRIKIQGTYILQEKLFDFKSSLTAVVDVISYIKSLSREKYPNLIEISSNVNIDKSINYEIEKIIDDKGEIKDDASPELKEIRTRLNRLSGEIDKIARKVLVNAKKMGWVNKQDDITMRNGRLVLPVLASSKRKIQGFIHDESATGRTVFIEPAEALHTNNEIRELESAEKREIIKILIKFTEIIRPEIDRLTACYNFLGLIDFIRAKAKLAISIDGVLPILNNKTVIEWLDAKHPLLFLSHKKQGKSVVPLSIKLNEAQRILVISGPNAGGKSVCLKTVGLLQYMLQCGLLVPMRETSETGIFKDIFIDIGDEQSIENDLSTYSSHLRSMNFFITKAGSRSLFLIDEFGTGTEPHLGGAIAEAVLEHLNRKKTFGVVTTHYSNLKIIADKTERMINGAMLFDTRKMQPLFSLQIGKPGSSFAFEIARKTGLPNFVLKAAEKKTGKTQVRFDVQLQQLEIEKKELIEKQKSVSDKEEKLQKLADKYDKLLESLENSKAVILKEARNEAARIISESNSLIENTIKEIREAQAEKAKTKQLREKLKEAADKIAKQEKEEAKKSEEKRRSKKKKVKEKKENDRIFVGNRVRIPPQLTVGEVVGISGKEAVVSFGSLILRSPLEKLVNVGEEEFYQKVMIRRSNYGNIINDLNTKMANFKLSLDLRGQRTEVAIPSLQRYIDEAILLNMKDVRIIHGKGNGILRENIRTHLRTISEVKKFSDEHVERGGYGVTVVELR